MTRWGLNDGIAGVVGMKHGCDSSTVDDRAQEISDVATPRRNVSWLTVRLGVGGTRRIGIEKSVRLLVSRRGR